MARPRTELGTWGRVSLTPFELDSGRWVAVPAGRRSVKGARFGRWRARCKVRDLDGKLRDVERWGDTRSEAENALRAALRDRSTPGDPAIGLTARSTLRDAAEAWEADLAQRDLAHGTRSLYSYAVNNYVLPLAGDLALREIRPPNVDRVLRTVQQRNGPASAKTTRAVLSGILGVAVRHGAIASNPVREAAKLSTRVARATTTRALTVAETEALRAKLRASEDARTSDLADLITFMLGTGCRLGEALAFRWMSLDEKAWTAEINATVIRVKGEGLRIQEWPKSAAGWRVLALPPAVAEMLRGRRNDILRLNPWHVAFPSPRGRLRDVSNTSGDLRKLLDGLGFEWVTSHTFRKTVATRLDEAGLSARQIADQLGHARPSLTQDVYMGRKVVTQEAALLL